MCMCDVCVLPVEIDISVKEVIITVNRLSLYKEYYIV